MGSHLWGWILPAGWSRLVSVINESTDGSEKAKVITERTKKGFYAISPFPSWLLWNIPQASQEAMKFFPAGVVVPLFNNHTLVKNPPVAVALFPIPPYSYPNCLTHHPHHPPHKKKNIPPSLLPTIIYTIAIIQTSSPNSHQKTRRCSHQHNMIAPSSNPQTIRILDRHSWLPM